MIKYTKIKLKLFINNSMNGGTILDILDQRYLNLIINFIEYILGH